ncbi:MAG: ABC transporter ATP-binding protein [Phycisphaerales bacterium]
MADHHVINITQASKTYRGPIHALRGVDLQVHRGEIFGLLGPNGAGKSTLVKILMTVIRPTACRGTMLGNPVGHKATLRRIGYLPEHHRFPEYLTGRQVLDFYGALCGVAKADRQRRADELLELVGLKDWQHTRVRQYSKGMRQRCGIAQALMNDPELVILDEPTDGVDPVGRRDIRNVLLEAKRRGKSVVVNSHLLSELEMVSDRVAILVQGRVAAQGTIDDLTRYGRRYELDVSMGDGPATEDVLRRAVQPLAGPAGDGRIVLADGLELTIAGDRVTAATDEAARVQPLIDAIRTAGLIVRAVRPLRPSLEDLFMRAVIDPATGGTLAPGAVDAPQRQAGRTDGRAQ